MPNIVAHYICGKLVAKKLNLNDDFIIGNLAPDYVEKERHYRVKGKMFEVPDIDKFIAEEKISNIQYKLGFLSHLMLDKLFLDGFVINNIYSKIDKTINIFTPDKIYSDYTNISKNLLNYYNLSIEEIDFLIQKTPEEFNISKYKKDTEGIKKSQSEYLQYLDINDFISFLDESADIISNYIKGITDKKDKKIKLLCYNNQNNK